MLVLFIIKHIYYLFIVFDSKSENECMLSMTRNRVLRSCYALRMLAFARQKVTNVQCGTLVSLCKSHVVCYDVVGLF